MPELPEVETLKRYLDNTSLHQRITTVEVRDAYVLKRVSARELVRRLKGRRFEKSHRHGKHLLVRAGNELWLRLAFDDQRKFGEIELIEDVDEFVETRSLGPDALEISFSQFKAILQKHRGAVKAILLNQQLIAGIGNLYADEILFRAR